MSVRLMSKAFESDIPTSAKIVLLALADFANDQGESIYPSVATLQRKTSLSERAVRQNLRILELGGYIEVQREGGGRKSNLWRIIPEKLEGGSKCPPEGHQVPPTGAANAPDPSLKHQGNVSETPEPVYVDDVQESKPKKKRGSERAPAPPSRMAEALAEVTGMSVDVSKNQLEATAAALRRDPRASPELIRQIYSPGGKWYTHDWRGKRGEKPTLFFITQTIFTFDPVEDNVIHGSIYDR